MIALNGVVAPFFLSSPHRLPNRLQSPFNPQSAIYSFLLNVKQKKYLAKSPR